MLKNVFEIALNMLEVTRVYSCHFKLNSFAFGLASPDSLEENKLLSTGSQRAVEFIACLVVAVS